MAARCAINMKFIAIMQKYSFILMVAFLHSYQTLLFGNICVLHQVKKMTEPNMKYCKCPNNLSMRSICFVCIRIFCEVTHIITMTKFYFSRTIKTRILLAKALFEL